MAHKPKTAYDMLFENCIVRKDKIAELMGVSRPYLWKLEKQGFSDNDAEKLEQIIHAYGHTLVNWKFPDALRRDKFSPPEEERNGEHQGSNG